MEKGPDVDITTFELKSDAELTKAAEKAGAEEFHLREKTKYLGIVESDAGQAIIVLIKKRLQVRIEQLVAGDAASKELTELLFTLGVKESQARNAVDALYQRSFKNT